jgi:hypothetical protein
MPEKIINNMGWLKYMHIKKLDNNKVGQNINPKPNTPFKNSLTCVGHKNNIKWFPPMKSIQVAHKATNAHPRVKIGEYYLSSNN